MAARYFYTKACRESNFYPHAFTYRGVKLPTSEHHLMREKARLMGDQHATYNGRRLSAAGATTAEHDGVADLFVGS